MRIGVIDQSFKKQSSFCWAGKCIYYKNDKYCYDGNLTKPNVGIGFKSGDKVTVNINFYKGTI